MKVSFLGAGAIGSMFGALLSESQPDIHVRLIVRGAFGEALIRNQSVEILGPWGQRRIHLPCSSDCAEISKSDLVIVTVKSQDTEAVLSSAAPYLGDATIVSIQNGINDSAYSNFVPPERQVMGMTSTNMAIVAPGQVKMQLDGVTLFGGPFGGQANVASHRVAKLFRRIQVPGLHFGVHDNILGIRYNKLAINALGYASCLSDSNFINEAIGSRSWRRSIGKPIVHECRSILATAKIQVERMPGRSDLSRVERLMNLLEIPVLGQLIRMAIRRRFERSPIVFSLLQDLRRGKPTEVDSINGQFVKLATEVECKSPINRTVVSIAHEIEGKPPVQFFSQQAMIHRVQTAIQKESSSFQG